MPADPPADLPVHPRADLCGTTVPGLLARLRASDPGRPRVTWYGADGERVELSARVLENWVAKTANLLVEELDAEPGTWVLLDLPAHWRSLVWLLALHAVGARTAARGADDADADADVVVTTAPAEGAPTGGRTRVVVVALGALARTAGPVPGGAVDYNAEVAGYGDAPPLVPGAPPLQAPAAGDGGPGDPGERVLLDAAGTAGTAGTAGLPVLARAVSALLVDGSVVLRGPGAPDAEHVAAVEGVTARG